MRARRWSPPAPRPAPGAPSAGVAIIRQTGIVSTARPARYRPERERDRGERRLVRAHRPGQRVAPHPGDQVGPPDDQPGLRPADQLVAAERDDVRPGRQPFPGEWLVGEAVGGGVEQRPGAQVVDDDRAVAMGDGRDLDRVRRLGEAGHREVRRMDAKDGLRPTLGQRRLEVGGPRPVRRPDLDQLRAGAPDDLGDPHATADLDELAARDDDPATSGEADRERDRGRVVVRHERVLGAGQGDQVLLGRPDACAATAGLAVQLEQQVPARQRGGCLGDGGRPRRSTEVRVDDDARGVDHGERAGIREAGDAGGDLRAECRCRPGRLPRRQPRPLVIDDGARGVHDRIDAWRSRAVAGLGRHRASGTRGWPDGV